MIGYVSFTFSLTASSVITSRLIYGAAKDILSFFHQRIFNLCMYLFFFVHASVGGLFGYFHIYLGYCNTVQGRFACLYPSNSVFLDQRSRNGPAESYGSSMFTFLRHLCSLLISGSFQFMSHLKLRVCISPQHLQHLLFVVFLPMVILIPLCG